MFDRAFLSRMFAIAFASCFLAAGANASAEIKSVVSMASLLDYADVVVLARPAESISGQRMVTKRFLVEEVLRGDRALKRQQIRVDLRQFSFAGVGKRVRWALLFLRRPEQSGDHRYQPVFSGIRYLLTTDGKVLIPQQWSNPGPYVFREDRCLNWHTLIADLRTILPVKNAMYSVMNDDLPPQWVKRATSGRRRKFAFEVIVPPPCEAIDFNFFSIMRPR
jgi:hypothetical protein